MSGSGAGRGPRRRSPVDAPAAIGPCRWGEARLGSATSPTVGGHTVWEPSTRLRRRVTATTVPQRDGHDLTVLAPDAPVGLVVLFDGERWLEHGIHDAWERAAVPRAVVLVPSGSLDRRRALLPHPEVVAAHVADEVLPAVEPALLDLPRIVAGQSYGGLAAAAIAMLRPDVAPTAIVQSGSFHFRADEPPRRPRGVVGDLGTVLGARARSSAASRLVLQAGIGEADMLDLAERFAPIARDAGAAVTLEAYDGGHDMDWWRHGLFDALDQLDAR